jgi:MYXO-CTERM domain-containing protein
MLKSGLLSLSFVLGSMVAFANDAAASTGAQAEEPVVWGGQTVSLCAWPTAVAVQGGGSLCTGTLIAPDVVMYAAHCGAGNKTIHFGENTVQGKNSSTDFCMTNPGYSGQSTDWAFCKLDVAVDIPTTPVGYGCEESLLQIGGDIFVVGFGNNQGQSGSGTKRWAESTVTGNPPANQFNVGGNGEPTVCSGDSGGPVFIQFSDGTFHTYGIASTKNSNSCDQALGTYAFAPAAVPWIEQNSGVDVTPCHDVGSGDWSAGPECGNFYTGGSQGQGTWSNWCDGTPALDWSSTCGPGFGNEEENNPPTVVLTNPSEDTCVTQDANPFVVTLDVNDDSGYINRVQLEIGGMLLPEEDTEAPWEFGNVNFPVGTWEVIGVAEDFWGNVGMSEPITVQMVHDEEDCLEGGDTTDESDDGGTSDDGTGEDDSGEETESGGTGEDGPPIGDEGTTPPDSGCGCSTDGGRAPGALVFSLLGIVALRRRRRG